MDLFWLYVDRRIAPGQCQVAEEQENPKFHFHHLVWLCWTEKKILPQTFISTTRDNYRRRVHSKGWKYVDLSQEGWPGTVKSSQSEDSVTQLGFSHVHKIKYIHFFFFFNETYTHSSSSVSSVRSEHGSCLPHNRSVSSPSLVGSRDLHTCVTKHVLLSSSSRHKIGCFTITRVTTVRCIFSPSFVRYVININWLN